MELNSGIYRVNNHALIYDFAASRKLSCGDRERADREMRVFVISPECARVSFFPLCFLNFHSFFPPRSLRPPLCPRQIAVCDTLWGMGYDICHWRVFASNLYRPLLNISDSLFASSLYTIIISQRQPLPEKYIILYFTFVQIIHLSIKKY